MTSTSSHYEVLGVNQSATERDIKKAFIGLLPDFPPEQKPREYQRLREAYDILSNPVARKEYDSMAAFGAEIEALKGEAEEIMHDDDPDYDDAIALLKKAIVLGPNIGMLRNMLGTCFLNSDSADKALVQFRAARRIDPQNTTYQKNEGRALKVLNRIGEAENIFRSVLQEDKEDYEAARALATLLHEADRTQEAIDVLDEAINADGRVDFQDFFCYYDKLHILLFAGRHKELEEELEVVVSIASLEAERSFAAFMLATTGGALYEVNAHTLARTFLAAAEELDPDNEHIVEMSENAQYYATIDDGLSAIVEDPTIHDFVRHTAAIVAGRHSGHIEEPDYEKGLGEIYKAGPNVMDLYPESLFVKLSVNRLKSEYPDIYGANPSVFEWLLLHPEPKYMLVDCPHCGQKIKGSRYDRSPKSCPHCNQGIIADKQFRFIKHEVESYDGNGCLVYIIIGGFLAALGY
jgi:tetratricopeptide (TPR) repeat protein